MISIIFLLNGLVMTTPPAQSSPDATHLDQSSNENMYQCGGILVSSDQVPNNLPTAASNLPNTWDWRNAIYQGIQGDWMTPVKRQGSCGSCWAFGVISMLEARLNILKKSSNLDMDLSEQHLVSCVTHGAYGCRGGSPYYAMSYLKNIGGAILEKYFPYDAVDSNGCDNWLSNNCDAEPVYCHDKLQGWDTFQVPLDLYGAHDQPARDQIKSWIVNYGPVAAYMTVYDDFNNYHDGVYRHLYGKIIGGHIVTLIGYDETGKYWIGKNSWGTYWGNKGYFKIAYGEADIEQQIYFADIDKEKLNFPPTADTGDLYYGSVGDPIQFSGENSYDFDNDIVSYEWNFGDGTQSTGQKPFHTYTQKGIYPVILTVTDAHGMQDMMETAVFIDLWNTGDSWTYHVDFETFPDALYPPIRLPGKGTIEKLSFIVTEETENTLLVDFQGTIDGDFSLFFDIENTIFDFRVWGKIRYATISGNIEFLKAGLCLASMQLQVKGLTRFILVPLIPVPLWIPTPFNIKFEKSLEDPQPLIGLAPEVGKSWETNPTNASLGITFSTLFGILSKTFKNDNVVEKSELYTCFEQKEIPTSAGIYEAIGMTIDSSYNTLKYYYAPKVSNLVKIQGGDIDLFSFSAELLSTTNQG
jgi:C1A family cysteine protease